MELHMSIPMISFNCQLTQPRIIWEETLSVPLAVLGRTTGMSVEDCLELMVISRHILNVNSTGSWARLS